MICMGRCDRPAPSRQVLQTSTLRKTTGILMSADRNHKNTCLALPNATTRSGPRGGPNAFVLREQLSQIFHSGGREGNRLLILGAMDPEATVLRIHLVG